MGNCNSRLGICKSKVEKNNLIVLTNKIEAKFEETKAGHAHERANIKPTIMLIGRTDIFAYHASKLNFANANERTRRQWLCVKKSLRNICSSVAALTFWRTSFKIRETAATIANSIRSAAGVKKVFFVKVIISS